jgi:hypothetical protein
MAKAANVPPCRLELHFSTAQFHLSHETEALQRICRAPARDAGNAQSYQQERNRSQSRQGWYSDFQIIAQTSTALR